MKDFYRISKERLEVYIDILDKASEIMRDAKPKDKAGKVNWQRVESAWILVIEVFNGLYGFKNYEDAEAGGEFIQDLWINSSDLDNYKFFKIEFPKGVKV